MEEPKPFCVASLADGGLNLAKRACQIADNESPDMLNFWRHDGQLKLRPGLRKAIEQGFGKIVNIYPRDGRNLLIRKITKDGVTIEEKHGIYIVTQTAVLCYDGEALERIADSLSYSGGWVSHYGDYDFESCAVLPSGSAEKSTFSDDNVTWMAEGEAICLVGSGYFVVISPQVVIYENPTGVPHFTAACLARSVIPHVPVLFEDCAANGTGTKVEDRNIISNECIKKFTTDAVSSTYTLSESGLDNSLVTAAYTTGSGSIYTFSFETNFTLATQNGILASLDRTAGTIYFTVKLVDAKAAGIKNNLVVTYSKTVCSKNPVSCCSVGIWYGGGTQTASGYSRMFLSGFEDTPNRIYYSAANDTAYFAENAYIDVGAPADPVTALGIQYDVLAVFKKDSVYSVGYSDTADSATFTVKEVNASVGCDMPATLRLASNTLFWCSSAGGVYALQSTTIKDERAVRLLSQNINAMLLALPEDDLLSASAVCDGTSYFLLVGDSAFILNYEKLHFKSGESPEGIAWFVFELPQKLYGVLRLGSHFAASSYEGTVYRFDDDAPDDDGSFFDAHWYSKSFDFGVPEKLKLLYKFILTVGCVGAVKLEVLFCDSAGEKRQTITVEGSGSMEESLSLYPASNWSQSASIGVRRVDGEFAPFGIIEFSAAAVPSAGR